MYAGANLFNVGQIYMNYKKMNKLVLQKSAKLI